MLTYKKFHIRDKISEEMMSEAKKLGMSDKQMGRILGLPEKDVRVSRVEKGIKPWVKQVRIY